MHICTACRKAEVCEATGSLFTAARKRAKTLGIELECVRDSCLSGCATGLTAMIETDAGIVRLQRVATAAQAADAVEHAADLIAGREVAGLQVLSRVEWSAWDET